MSDFIWPSDVARAESDELNRVCEHLEEVWDERDALAAKLSRHTMDAGHAEQRRAESRAVREALGFEPDADDVSPRDLLDAIARLIEQKQAEAIFELTPCLVTKADQQIARHKARCHLKHQAKEPAQ